MSLVSVIRLLPLLFFFLLGSQINLHAQKKNPEMEKRINRIIQSMTLEEKVGQMSQVTLDVLGKRTDGGFAFDTATLREVIQGYKVGSILNTADNTALSVNDWRSLVAMIQQEAAKNRLNIPVIYGFDAIHGANYVAGATLYPQQIGLAATWNPTLVQQAARLSAYESRASSVIWNFSPVLDLGINPLWPRQWETFGEDPYLVSKMGAATVKGYQEPLGSPTTVIACLKHFLAYSDPKSGKDRTNVQLSEQDLREYHLPAFRESLAAGARTVMLNSGLINGVPTHMNKRIITDLLKNELGFTGFTVTDWKDIDNLYSRDKVAVSEKEAVLLAINAGVDMAMIPYDYKPYAQYLTELVKEKKVPMSRVDDAVRRILRVKMEAGLFDAKPSQYDAFGAASHEALAKSVVAESITVLKNSQQVLPLQPGKSILVTGPNANSMRTLNGGWSYSWQGEKTEFFAGNYNTILKAVQNQFGKEKVRFEPGVVYNMNGKYFQDSIVDLIAVQQAASDVDYILLCLGENSYTEKPGDLQNLYLSENQILLAKTAIQTNKPVILILNEGRPRIISSFEAGLQGIIQLYLPGNYGADALAEILAGTLNPSGRLPYTYPRFPNSLTPYIHKYSDEQVNPQGAYDYSADYNPQFDFGHGLSYTSFSYTDLKLNASRFKSGDTLQVSVTVKNTGQREGKEVVRVYISDLVATVAPDVRRLRGFEKINLAAGASKQVTIRIPLKDLSFTDERNRPLLESGSFRVQVETLQTSFEVVDTKRW